MAYNRQERMEWCLDGFLASCNLIKNEFEKKPGFIGIPLLVNAAFACELAMKRIIERQTGKPVKGHELQKLWGLLDPAMQAKVMPLVCSTIPLEISRFDEYMGKCSGTFVDWRYQYEMPDNFSSYLFLFHLATVLRQQN